MALESGSRNVEWLDRCSDSRYPLSSWASATDITGRFTLPNDFLVSWYMAVPASLRISTLDVFISKVINANTAITIFVTARVNGVDAEIARADLSEAALETQIATSGYGLALLRGIGDYADIRGRVTVARLENIQKQPVGTFTFDRVGGLLDPDGVRPSLQQLTAVEVETQAGQYTRLTGPIRLSAGANTRLRVETQDGEPVVIVDALDASQFNEQLECEYGTGVAIKRINGLPGNAQREVQVQPSRCIDVQAAGDTLALRNACSEPCASCVEAEAIKAIVDPMAAQVPGLTNFVTRLESAIIGQQTAISLSQAPLACESSPPTSGGPTPTTGP